MLMLKLSRRGKKKQPSYRLIVVDKKKDPWGMIKEDVGSYNPHTKKAQFKVERIRYWLSKGAQPSSSVHNLLVREKILEAAKEKVKIKKKFLSVKATGNKPVAENAAQAAEAPNTTETQNPPEKIENPATETPKTETLEEENKVD